MHIISGWLPHQAIRIANAVSDLDIYMEQPCKTYEECLMVRQHTNLPFVMDENVNGIDMLLRMYNDRAADVVNLKISKFGGLTKTKQVGRLYEFIGIVFISNTTRLNQCPMPINAAQNHGIGPKCLSMPINADQFRSVLTD